MKNLMWKMRENINGSFLKILIILICAVFVISSISAAGPIVHPLANNAPTLTRGSVSPTTGDTSTTFTYQVTYSDADGDAPVNKSLYIDWVRYNMNLVSGNFTSGAIYQYTTTLKKGTHNYYFYFTDGKVATRLPSNGTYSGPTVTGGSGGGPNNPPTLNSGIVIPYSGDTKFTFTYKVTYKDIDDDKPTIKRVYIDSSPYTMNYLSGNNKTGAIYQYKTKFSVVGLHNYYFYFKDNNDTVRLPINGTYSGPLVNGSSGPNNSPTLSSGSVSPKSGTTSTTFRYKVIYTDADNDPPVVKRVYIDGKPNTMSYSSGSYISGATFVFSTKLPVGNHTYYFYFTDGNGTARLPVNGTYYGPLVTSGSGGTPNKAPTLTNGFVTPTSGTTTTKFTYQVTYRDADNDPPILTTVYIDRTPYTMKYVSGNYTGGAIYQYTTTLGVGNHSYAFYFMDTYNNSAWIPNNGTYSGPVVTTGSGGKKNSAPTLANGTVSPQFGTTTTVFTYSVTYRDADNDPPTIRTVYIDGKPKTMNYVSGNYKSGAIYQYKTMISTIGTHTYYYFFKDSGKTAKDPYWNYYYGPTVNRTTTNNPPTLSKGSVSPQSGTTSTLFTYQVIYKDIDNEAPGVKNVIIDSNSYTMKHVSGSYINGSTFQYTTTLSKGNHTYYFQFTDGRASVRLPQTGVFNGPIVSAPNTTNKAPTLLNGIVSPTSGNTSTFFIYQVTYKDTENDLPRTKQVYIDNVGYTMKYVSGNHITGALYQYETKLSIGNHTFFFNFNDGKLSARLPLTGSYFGPRVTKSPINNPPTLYSGIVSPTIGTNMTQFVYQVYYKDIDSDSPSVNKIYIDNKPVAMSYVRGSYSSGALYQYKTTLGVGSHNFYFYFSDGNSPIRLPTKGTYFGPNVTSGATTNMAPIANAGPDQTLTVGSDSVVEFSAEESRDPDNDELTYFWDFGDGSFGFGSQISHEYKVAGTYEVTLTVWDGEYSDKDICLIQMKDSGEGKTEGEAPKKSISIYDWVIPIIALVLVLIILTILYVRKRQKREI